MKREKLTFWVIGFGCGMVVTGMIGALLTLDVQQQEEKQPYIKSIQQETSTQQGMPLPNDEEHQDISEQGKALTQVTEKEDKSSSTKTEQKEEVSKNQQVVKQDKVESVRTVTIPAKLSASEICKILEKNGIVKDGNEFLEYVKEKKKQTYLKSGQYTLPVEASYDIILEELIS